MAYRIIGWDTAVQPVNNGLVCCQYAQGRLSLVEQWHLDDKPALSLEQTLQQWIVHSPDPVLLCIDAPLGWPEAFAGQLTAHQAGESAGSDDVQFFKRLCDLHVRQTYNKIPLDITSDLVARAAFFTLKRLAELRQSIPQLQLLWDSQQLFSAGFIEVYPASTLIASGLKIRRYKSDQTIRQQFMTQLSTTYNMQGFEPLEQFSRSDHAFDALVCCMAGVDFIEGRCIPPPALNPQILREGWVWTRPPAPAR